MIYKTIAPIRTESVQIAETCDLLDTNPKLAVKKFHILGWSVDCWELRDGGWKREEI